MPRSEILDPKMKELISLLNLIGGALQYAGAEDARVILDENRIFNLGLDKQDIKNCLRYLSEQRIADAKITYAPTETKPMGGGIVYASHTSHRSDEYDRVEYIFSIDRKKIAPLLSQAAKLQVPKKDDARHLLENDVRRDYYYDGKRIEMSHETIYYKIFDIVFSHCDQQGFISYANIEKHLVRRGCPASTNAEVRNKRINNALRNKYTGLFRFAKINGNDFENRTLNGQPLIKLKRGEGVFLNNPPL